MAAGDLELRIPFATLLKVALFLLLAVSVMKIWPVILMLIVAVLLAVMLAPIVAFCERHRVRRGFAVAVLALLIFGLLVVFFATVVPSMGRQIGDLASAFPRLTAQLTKAFPRARPFIAALTKWGENLPQSPQLRGWLTKGMAFGLYAVEALTALVLTLVLAIYLLLEGKVALAWLISFAVPATRSKLARTADEVTDVIIAYMRGQVITCCICGAYAFLVLTILHVPAALPLAVLAFLADLVPVVGTIVMTLPAVLLALTVSPVAAVIVVVAYLFYHFVESYFIIPRVYGRTMRLSTLTVLLAVTVGGTLQGALGAILVLPFVAAWPIVERIWFRDRLPADTVPKHDALEGEDDGVSEKVAEEIVGGE